MVSSEVAPNPHEMRDEAEVMSFGPASPNRLSRRALWLAGLAGLLVAVAVAVWVLIPKPPPDFSAEDLGGVYTGMVRSDGLNEVSTLSRDQHREPPARITPTACAPLFDATLSNQFPAAALDGVSTYWLNAGSASISLVTYRYPDTATARRDYEQVLAALKACSGNSLSVDRSRNVLLQQQSHHPTSKFNTYQSYVVSTPPETTRFTTDVMQLANTVTWQYRYEYSPAATYSPSGAEQLMESLISQMLAVQDTLPQN